MAKDLMADPHQEAEFRAVGKGVGINGADQDIEEIDDPILEMDFSDMPPLKNSLEWTEQNTGPIGVHDGTQVHHEQLQAMTINHSVSHGGWQSMPFEGEIEQVFAWKLGEGSEGFPALDFPESLILVEDEKPEDMLDNSPSRLEWLRQKRDDDEENEHMDQVMAMIGHEQVKKHFLAIKDRVAIARKWNEDPKELKLNLVLYGGQDIVVNRIAYLYSNFLFSVGAIPRIRFKRIGEWPAPGMARGSRPTVIQFLETNKDNETPESDTPSEASESDTTGRASESTTTGKASIVNAEYEDEQIQYMVKKNRKSAQHMVLVLTLDKLTPKYSRALERNLQARREFPTKIRLGGYSERELVQLLVRMIKQRSLQVEGGFGDSSLRVLVRRVLRRHGSSSTSEKIRALESELDVVCYRCEKRQEKEYIEWARTHSPADEAAHRAAQADDHWRPIWPRREPLIRRKDIFGPEPEDIRNKSVAWKTVQQLIGLESVKMHIAQLFKRAKINYQREIRGLDPIPVSLNRVFVGDPGVGKTSVARLYGQILCELGMLSKGGIFESNPSGLIDSVIGGSEVKTKAALEAAMGNVWIIDGADTLYHGSGYGTTDTDEFRAGMIDTIVANVSGKPGEDRCVILVGNKDGMEEMFLHSNPGLQRRFPIEDAVHFENYNVDQLCQILDLKMREDGSTKATKHAKKVARDVLSRMSERPKFGNAGDVVNLLARARLRHAERLEAAGNATHAGDEGSHVVTLEPEDFDPDYDRASRADRNRDSLFSGFVGFENIVDQFRQYQLMANGMRKHQIDPRPHIPWAFIFKGPPGTGKTSTARKVGKLFYDMGLLSSDEVVVCSVTDLVGQHQGRTGPKVINLFETALGKVLFIDEAYRLTADRGSANPTNEAVGELVDAMTKPRYSGKMVVVLAGYTEEMEELLQSNSGLRSRFPTHVDFPRMRPQQCVQHLRQELGKLRIDIGGSHFSQRDVEKWDNIHRVLTQLSVTKGWANGRDIETLAKTLIAHVFVRAGSTSKTGSDAGKAQLEISLDELSKSLQDLLRERNQFSKGGIPSARL